MSRAAGSPEQDPPRRSMLEGADGPPLAEAMTIGQLVGALEPEFPGLSISKVRYLEDRGLLAPRRTPSGYRTYGPIDVRRLRTILTLQRDEFLPLDVIQERLDRGTATPLGRRLSRVRSRESVETLHQEEQSFTWQQAAELIEVDEDFLRELADYHLIAERRGGEGRLTDTDLDIARMCRLLARFGLEPRNLRLLRSSVEREVALLEQVVLPDLRSSHSDRRAQGEQTLQDLASLLSQLVDHLLYKEVRRLVE